MKNFNSSVFFVLLAALLSAGARPALAQQQFSDAEVDYTVDVEPPAGSSFAVHDSRLTYNFKSYFFRSEMHIGRTVYTNIHDSRTHAAVVLIDAGANKYLIKMNENQLKQEDKRFAGVTFTDGTETMEIAGYPCKMAIGKLADGSTFTVFYTPDLIPENKGFSERFKGLNGLPLKFTMTTENNTKMTMTATRVTVGPQPASLFAAPTSGYRLLTYEELQKMRDNR